MTRPLHQTLINLTLPGEPSAASGFKQLG